MRNLQSSQVSQANQILQEDVQTEPASTSGFRHKICCNCNKCFTNGKSFNRIVKSHLKVE